MITNRHVPLMVFFLGVMSHCSSNGASDAGATAGTTTSNSVSMPTATLVYGQAGSFTSNNLNKGGLSADSLNEPFAAAADSGGVYIVDQKNHRVLYFAGTSTTATRVYGQGGSFTTNTANKGGRSADSLNQPYGVAVDSGGVYIADTFNIRVLYYPGTSTTATRVYGQSGNFTTANSPSISADSLSNPLSVAVDSGGVYITDSNRVLYYPGTSTTATRVYGQGGSFSTNSMNNGGLSANSLQIPLCVSPDSSGVYIADAYNHRVLYFNGTSTTATRVYGQGDSMTSNTSNASNATANTLTYPFCIAATSNGVYTTDGFYRALYFSGTSTTATGIFGQTTYGTGTVGISAQRFYAPRGIALGNGGLYIVDTLNHRVLFFNL
ncbi:MAG: NHL repeat-containing protein [Spirochaetota bacterium]